MSSQTEYSSIKNEESEYSQAKKMSIEDIQKKQNRSQSIENVLSSSIARAKEKIQKMEQKKNLLSARKDTSREKLNRTSEKSIEKKENQNLLGNLQSNEVVSSFKDNQEEQEAIETTRSKNLFKQQELSKEPTSSGSTVVNVVKTLQSKVAELERLNESNEREKIIMTKEMQNISEEKKMLFESLEDFKRKNLDLEQNVLKSNKLQIKDLKANLEKITEESEELKNTIKELELKFKQQHQNNLSIQKAAERKSLQKKKQDSNDSRNQELIKKMKEVEQRNINCQVKEKELKDKESKLSAKWKELIEKEEELMGRESSLSKKETEVNGRSEKSYEELARHNQTMSLANQVRKELEEKTVQQKQTIDRLQQKVNNLEIVLREERLSKEQFKDSIDQNYQQKIEQLEDELQSLRETTSAMARHGSRKNMHMASSFQSNIKCESLKDELADLTEQYEEMFDRFKKTEEKLEKQKKESKNYRTKFWKLKDIIAEIQEKVSKMSESVQSQLKLLIVKANKLESYEIQKSSLSNLYGTPNKKSRSNSYENRSLHKSNTRSSSKSKKKPINLTNLDNSRKSNKQSGSKSKRSQKSDRGSASKKKSIHLSSTNRNSSVFGMNTEQDIKISQLEKQVQTLKTTYRKMVELMNDHESEETRNELNNLACELQQKTEELTKLKKLRKNNKKVIVSGINHSHLI